MALDSFRFGRSAETVALAREIFIGTITGSTEAKGLRAPVLMTQHNGANWNYEGVAKEAFKAADAFLTVSLKEE